MKSVFMALWCFCFMLIAVIGCDQEMNMMKPVMQDVMDAKPEDEPDTIVPTPQPDAELMDRMDEPDIAMPTSEPIAEVEPDVEMMEPTVLEPNVEVPPVSVEEPSDIAEEMPEEPSDPYTPLNGLTVSGGGVRFLFFSALHGCVHVDAPINGVFYTTHSSKWQQREDPESPWIDIQGTEKASLCPYSPEDPGQYRLVCEISINGVRGKYASGDILIVE